MLKRFRFTSSVIAALPAHSARSRSTESEYSDIQISGLKLLSGKSGSKRFLLRYILHARKCSIAIGRFPNIDVSTASKIAWQHKQLIAQGEAPREEKPRCGLCKHVVGCHQFSQPQAKRRIL